MASTTKRLTASQRNDLLKRYRGRVDHARKARNNEGVDALWDKMIDLYRGKHFNTQLLNTEDRIAVNICFATINVIAPSIAVNYPKLLIWSRKAEDEFKAQILETVLNYWWRSFRVQHEAALAVKDYLVIGHGWVKVGWRYVEEQKLTDKRELTEAHNVEHDDKQIVPDDPNEPTANDPDSESTDNEPEFEVVEDRPFVERVSPFDVYVDPEAKTLAAAKWIAQKIVKPLEEVRQDKRYRARGRAALRPDARINPEWLKDDEGTFPEDDVRRVTLYEFYDMQMGTMCVFAALGDEMLLDPIPQPYAFGHPFVMLRNYDVPDEFYPMGDIEALEPLQMELDKTRSQMMNHRKRFNRKWLYDPSAFDETGISALNKDTDNQLVPILEGSNKELKDILAPIPQNPVEPQLYQYEDSTLELMDRVSGASEYMQGKTPDVRKTATEAAMVQDAANARAADKLQQVELFMAEIAEKVVQLAQQYMTEDSVVRIIGKNGHPLWIPYSREDIQGEFDFEVEAGSTQPKNDQFRRNQALQLLQALTPWAQAGLVNAQVLLRYALQFGFEVKNPDEFMGAPMPPQQGDQQKSPHQSIMETMNYKDLPPDVQRQLEAAAGFQPSQVGGSSPAEGHLAKVVPQIAAQRQAAAQGQAQLAAQQAEAQAGRRHEAVMTHATQQHDMRGRLADAAIAMDQQGAQQQHDAQQTFNQQMLEAYLAQQAINERHAYQVENAGRDLGIV